MKHPTRVHALSVLTDRPASPRELAEELGEPINNVGYHLDVLLRLALIELVAEQAVHGGRVTEHFYRAIERAWLHGSAWRDIGGPQENPAVTGTIMELINGDIAKAVAAGTFDGEDNHISRTPLVVDRAGYAELVDLLDGTLAEGIFGIRERVANRITSGTETTQTVVNIVQFDLPESAA